MKNDDYYDDDEEEIDEYDNDDDDDDSENNNKENKIPICSVLNTVVNHVMVPPNPLLEEEEYNGVVANNAAGASSSSATSTTLVPVLRIFGPILRHGCGNKSNAEPVQSACLYIHGAFPYLLARPKIAGPDGSMYHHHRTTTGFETTTTTTTMLGHVDWDSVESVQNALETIQQTLEETIHNQQQQQQQSDNDLHQQQQKADFKQQQRILRSVTVVIGRGFYTYCPGPSAPFLRIEYYDPQSRWKIKLALERGLDLPQIFHPDSQQYDYNDNHNNASSAPNNDNNLEHNAADDGNAELLKFHCYEAHIPYTMQFFKDWNLAGMSYIHIKDGKFRTPLPTATRHRSISNIAVASNRNQNDNANQTNDGNSNNNNNKKHDESGNKGNNNNKMIISKDNKSFSSTGFLLSNTPSNFLWQTNNFKHDDKKLIIQKETSCDVEIDIHVNDILNVQTVITSLPTNKEERQQIHWRAVPSLYEIWQQERLRMSKLLSRKDDFLSQKQKKDEPPTFTLNVKKDAAIPGTRLALKGMRRLVDVSTGLQTNFNRSMKDIMYRYSDEIERLDQKILLSHQKYRHRIRNDKQQSATQSTMAALNHTTTATAMTTTTTDTTPVTEACSLLSPSSSSRWMTPSDKGRNNSSSLSQLMATTKSFTMSPLLDRIEQQQQQQRRKEKEEQQKQVINQQSQLTPSFDEAVEALGALAGQFREPEPEQTAPEQEPKDKTPSLDEAVAALGALAGQFDKPEPEPDQTTLKEELEDKNTNAIGGSIYYSQQSSSPSFTPSSSRKLELFHSLSQSYYNNSSSNSNGNNNYSYNEGEEDMVFASSLSQSLPFSSPPSQKFFSQQQSQSQHEMIIKSQDLMELSQRLDRGESIVDGPFQYTEDFINPQTLTPYEILDDEDDDGIAEDYNGDPYEDEDSMDEKGLELELSILATQNYDGASSTATATTTATAFDSGTSAVSGASTSASATPDATFTPITTGVSRKVEETLIDDDSAKEEEEEEEEEEDYNCNNLDSKSRRDNNNYRTPEGVMSRLSNTEIVDDMIISSSMSDGNANEEYENENDNQDNNNNNDINNKRSGTTPITENIRKAIQFPPKPWKHPANVYIERKQPPPSRAKVQLPNARLLYCHHQPSSERTPPSWLVHSARYASFRKDMEKKEEEAAMATNNNTSNSGKDSKKNSCRWFPKISSRCRSGSSSSFHHEGVYMQPVRRPPNRKMVVSWYNKHNNNEDSKLKLSKKRKKTSATTKNEAEKKKKKERTLPPQDSEASMAIGKKSICSVSNLEVDGNSRKLVSTNLRDDSDDINNYDKDDIVDSDDEIEEKSIKDIAKKEQQEKVAGKVLTMGSGGSGDHHRMVEEVEWKSSQSPCLSLSQVSGGKETPKNIIQKATQDSTTSSIETKTNFTSPKNSIHQKSGLVVVSTPQLSDKMTTGVGSSGSISTPIRLDTRKSRLTNSQSTAESSSTSNNRITRRENSTNTTPGVGSLSSSIDESTQQQQQLGQSSSTQETALEGMGNQGGKLWVAGGATLKAKTRPPSQMNVTQTQRKKGGPISGQKKGKRDAENEFSYHRYLPSPVSIISVEVHVQCRSGRAGINDSKEIAMTPDPDRDMVYAVVYVHAKDPGGGVAMEIIERGCLFVPVGKELGNSSSNSSLTLSKLSKFVRSNMPQSSMGVSSPLVVQAVKDERQLLLRLASIVRLKDPDMLLSWDTQSAGLGYLIERGSSVGINLGDRGSNQGENPMAGGGDTATKEIDMVRLLGRTPTVERRASSLLKHSSSSVMDVFKTSSTKPTDGGGESKSTTSGLNPDKPAENKLGSPRKNWEGSGLGSEWDERVGAGAAASSIIGRLVFAAWKLIADEVKHPNASYLPAVVATVLNKRIPYHDNLTLTNWYGYRNGRERWRVLHHRLVQATASLLLFDALDIIGRAGEAARLSGVEFSQSFPGIRGSQYKVEGVLLRALQSLHSEERGSKKGKQLQQQRKQKKKVSGTTYSGTITAATADYTPLVGRIGTASSSSCFSDESKSQTQTPWKARRMGAARRQQEKQRLEPRGKTSDEKEGPELSKPVHEFSSRGYFFYSPSLQDSNKQEALEAQALTLEPQSGHHQDPVIVCDFTALYPSLVIAYNLCYSTCAGRLDYHSTRAEMYQEGKTTGQLGPFLYSENRTATVLKHHMKSLNNSNEDGLLDENDWKEDRAYIAPTGTIYVSESVLKGVLPQVLDELLSTRAMLKKASKEYKRLVPNLCPSILRQIEARQLALKYVANVTYGYTSATFSGRCAMPLLADTIVECGRRTLNNAIRLANRWGRDKKGRWHGCEVIYGDTDSVFIKLPGRSVKEAFQFGEQFCKAVTDSNPPPVQLKLEKVYLGSIMQTKKKYCGMKFESPDQKKPVFEAKGIETIRRDQCALTQKVLRNALVTLFRNDVGAVQEYLCRQWSLILSGQLPVSDFILTGRVKSRYRGGRVGPVQATLARRLAEADPGKVVRHKERLAYVIVATPGVTFRLRDCVLTPMELLEQWDAYTIHTAYYITKHVNAALQRCLGLAPHYIDVNSWYETCPKPRRRIHHWPVTRSGSSSMISSYFGTDMCSLCGKKCMAQGRARAVVCSNCKRNSGLACYTAMEMLRNVQEEAHSVARSCSDCNQCYEDASTFAVLRPKGEAKKSAALNSKLYEITSHPPGVLVPLGNCSCIDCPTTYKRHRLREAEVLAESICHALNI